jgi:putative chitinase
MIDAGLLKVACPESPATLLAQWADPIKKGCVRFGIDKVREIAALLAQAGHECAGFQRLEENLNYSAQRMAEVWPKRFAVPRSKPPRPNALALALHRRPVDIANHTYANRMGNGPPESGDGWRFRGYGPFQLTGRNNHQAFADAMGIEIDVVPDFIRTLEGAALSACWFFKVNGLEDLAMTPGVADETKRINGGLHGLPDRKKRFDAVVKEMLRRGAA